MEIIPELVDSNKEELAELERLLSLKKSGAFDNEDDSELFIEETKTNLNIFLQFMQFMQTYHQEKTLIKNFYDNFDSAYRSKLYDNICAYFEDDDIVTDEIIFYWKLLVVNLINQSKHAHLAKKIEVDFSNKVINLKLVKKKCLFECYLEGEHVGYFKDNGNNYYVC